MAKYSTRRILARELAIFNATGKVMILYVRNAPAVAPSYTPGNLFLAKDPTEDSTNFTARYIRGKFDESDSETYDGPGRRRNVKGIISVPMLYKAILAACEYIDPYLDGSRFIKKGASVDESRVFITQEIELMAATNPSDIV